MPKLAVYTSMIKNVMKDIEKKDEFLRLKAARHIAKKVKARIKKKGISQPGEPPGKFSGNLVKGIKAKKGGKYFAFVGAVKPAYHALLLELGTRKMRARPFLFPTMQEEKEAVIKILSEQRV